MGRTRILARTGLGLAVTLGLAAGPPPALAAPADRATLAGSVPAWAGSASFKGAAAGSDAVGFRVYLGWNDDAQVEALATSVSDPHSAAYGHYLTPQQFRQRFAPSQAAAGAVRSWLQGQGFSIDYTPQNNHYVQAEGTVAQANAAFSTSLGWYAYRGLTLRAPSSALSVPSSLASAVSGVVGLDDSAALVHTDMARGADAPPSAGFRVGTPCSTYWAEKTTADIADPNRPTNPYGPDPLPMAPCGYTPQQVRGAYGLTPQPGTGDGHGATVAIIDAYASPTMQQDLDTWSARRGIPSTRITQVVAPGTFRHPQSNAQDPQGWYGEETLDVEAVHGMAPGASIVFVGAANNYQDLDAALNHVVDRGLAEIVTNSYGFSTEALPPGFVKPFEETILQGVAEGIGIYFSSGDDSDESQVVGYTTPDWPASSPFVTAVGGTTLGVGAGFDRVVEAGWGTFTSTWSCAGGSCHWAPAAPGAWLYGAGGGVSCLFERPAYQASAESETANAQTLCPGHLGRGVPDVSALGDPNTGYLVGQTQTFAATSGAPASVQYDEFRLGGTSLSSPLTAGLVALVDSARLAAHQPQLGFANPALYALGEAAYHDVLPAASPLAVVRVNYNNSQDASDGVSYRLRTTDLGLSLHTAPGWDDITGLGSPTAALLAGLGG